MATICIYGLVKIIYLHHKLLKIDDLHNHESRINTWDTFWKIVKSSKEDSFPDACQRSRVCCRRLKLLKIKRGIVVLHLSLVKLCQGELCRSNWNLFRTQLWRTNPTAHNIDKADLHCQGIKSSSHPDYYRCEYRWKRHWLPSLRMKTKVLFFKVTTKTSISISPHQVFHEKSYCFWKHTKSLKIHTITKFEIHLSSCRLIPNATYHNCTAGFLKWLRNSHWNLINLLPFNVNTGRFCRETYCSSGKQVTFRRKSFHK